MGQKVNPTSFRTGIMIGWKSRWYASKKEFSELLIEDFKIRKFIKEKHKFAGMTRWVGPLPAPTLRFLERSRGIACEAMIALTDRFEQRRWDPSIAPTRQFARWLQRSVGQRPVRRRTLERQRLAAGCVSGARLVSQDITERGARIDRA